jgi:hypothetical protein
MGIEPVRGFVFVDQMKVAENQEFQHALPLVEVVRLAAFANRAQAEQCPRNAMGT